MTRDEVLAMKPGRELDALVSEKVMRWEYFPEQVIGTFIRLGYFFDPISGEAHHHWSPSTDISAAWEVVEALRSKYEVRIHMFADLAYVTIYEDYRIVEIVQSRSVPEAICKAALLAVIGEDETHD